MDNKTPAAELIAKTTTIAPPDPIATPTTKASAGKRIYSRDELFRLASRMEGLESMGDILNEHWHYDYASQPLKQFDNNDNNSMEDYESLPRQTFASFGRKKSDLGATHKKIYRMSSSPSIKYNRLVADDQLDLKVKARYAQLIEGVRRSHKDHQAARPNFGYAPANDELATDQCHSLNVLEQQTGVKRPDSLFGPLRRHSNEFRSRGPAGDEPMSLPYSINMQATRDTLNGRGQSTNNSRSGKYNFGNEAEEDDFDISNLLSITVLSDIRFIRQELNQTPTSRAQHRATTTSNSLAANAANVSSAMQRAKSHEMNVRMPPRSRTSLDFHLGETRRRAHLLSQHQHHQNLFPHTNQASNSSSISVNASSQASGIRHHPNLQQLVASRVASASEQLYNSLDETVSLPFNWQVNSNRNTSRGLFIDPKVALDYHLKCKSNNKQDKTGTGNGASAGGSQAANSARQEQDPDRAKIIETFKAQVLARASSTEDEAGASGEPKGASNKADQSKKATSSNSPQATATKTGSANETAKPVADAKLDKTSQGETSSRENAAPETLSSKSVASSLTEPAKVEELKAYSSAVPKADSALQDSSHRDESSTKAIDKELDEPKQAQKVTSRTSNIPRLVSLHRGAMGGAFSRSSTLDQDDGNSYQSLPAATRIAPVATTTTTLAQPANSRSNLKPGSKFVSQYKLLRGKSLADEVEESAKS